MHCLDIDQLDGLAAGSLAADEATRIEDHIRICGRCAMRLEEIRANLLAAGSIASLLRQDEYSQRKQAAAAGSSCDATLRTPVPPMAHGESHVVSHMPEWIGAYRILREIGRGGMGVVYEAEQSRPRRTVAIKVLRSDIATSGLLRRFEHELQMLARLQHPGIAQVYEAATFESPEGPRPYFALERVDGLPLRKYLQTRAPAPRERLDLLAAVCDAVHHAHQKGIIHRDLKPGNIMVDAVGRPKVLDFGVARLTDGDDQSETRQTDVGQLVGTVPYMSPEQLSGDPNALDIRSDIYALGVIAYEALAGRLPHDIAGQPIVEAVRMIRDGEPTPIAAVNKSCAGDVATIVHKALAREKERRYQSAAELADDIRRFLRDEPITARPPTAAYLLQKFARRNKPFVAASAVVLITLIAATAVSALQARRAVRAEQQAQLQLAAANDARDAARRMAIEAQKQADKAAAVRTYLEDMLAAAQPDREGGRHDITVRQTLEAAEQKLANGSLDDQPELAVAAYTTIGNTYRSLGHFAEAEPMLRRAVDIGRETYPQGHEDLAFALNKLARTLQEQTQFEEAESLFLEALAMRRRLHGERHEHVATILNNLGYLDYQRGRFAGAETFHQQALSMQRGLPGDHREGIATSMNNLALVYIQAGDFPKAEEMLRESLAIDVENRGPEHPKVLATMSNLSHALAMMNRIREADSIERKALAIRRRVLPPDHPDTAASLNNLAIRTSQLGNNAEAETLYREALDIYIRIRGPRHAETAQAMTNLGMLLLETDRPDEARQLVADGLAIRRESLGDKHPVMLDSLFKMSLVYSKQGQTGQAARQLEECIALAREVLPARHWQIGAFLRAYGENLIAGRQFAEAEKALLEGFKILSSALGEPHRATQSCIRALAALYAAWEKPEQQKTWATRLAATP